MRIKIKYRNKSVPRLKIIDKGDWIDLAVWENIDLRKGEQYLIDLGVAMELPEGYEAHMIPRSSTALKHGIMLANSKGLIDNVYSGDEDYWKFLAYALRDTYIPKGTRIAQFRLVKSMGYVALIEVDHLGNENRGGHGSTGI